ncbi:hypothetical protein Nepgr_005829 [Nepenthes gracilis]|uniref:Uncharacterized protein n=1 Tax=Nepenthes gracilis TaxID=150966 RepID=A0AAD3XGT9_NEPGR|nr:hypothetical protein Nepgr_005829 [Nepenthes gracilis]
MLNRQNPHQLPAAVIFLVAFVSILAAGDEKETVAVGMINDHSTSNVGSEEKIEQRFKFIYSSKRRVPNAFDPLHNRR